MVKRRRQWLHCLLGYVVRPERKGSRRGAWQDHLFGDRLERVRGIGPVRTAVLHAQCCGVTMHVGLALAGARHIFMVTYWQRVKIWLCRTLNCEHCLRCKSGDK